MNKRFILRDEENLTLKLDKNIIRNKMILTRYRFKNRKQNTNKMNSVYEKDNPQSI